MSLSYQHAYHAGGPADLAKHLVLATLLAQLTRKKRPVAYFETHAGRGLYDLGGVEAQKTGEAAEGVEAWEKALGKLPPHPFTAALRQVRAAYGPRAYPGSPLVARALLRDTDLMALMELHPAEHRALCETFDACALPGPDPLIEKRDGGEGARDRLPPSERRGLVLIDPSYELKEEYVSTGQLAMDCLVRWPEAIIAVWYPILPAGRHMDLRQKVSVLRPLVLENAFELKGGAGMTGTGMLILNAPHGTEASLSAALALGAPVLQPMPRRGKPARGAPKQGA
ncbi:23S rRNA (adenine(2030)-N(6))-methyltransferase RlmJ [Rhodovulum sp. DZ06]|uniref:23S rRNA (adenine(2030)-N(6))-methyltransferase RlmJ n=1 Tax=Rhodovulum sp. DZ06 TaxID=3425126 RepID=UPI003D324AFF